MNTTPFLQLVAGDLRKKYGNDLSKVTIVFPNKRAGIFFNDYLMAEQSELPVWAPSYCTISELFRSLSPLKVVDEIEAICKLYPIYNEQMKGERFKDQEPEPLDMFYGWGQRLLADFDDIDKNLAPTHKLFENFKDWKQVDETFRSEEAEALQIEAGNELNAVSSLTIQKKFGKFWRHIEAIYTAYNQQLKNEGLAYEGHLYRSVVEGEINLPVERQYVFVGFNVLDKAEQTLFSIIQKREQALFYWDYDKIYVEGNQFEAGTFLKENMKLFPNELKNEELFNNILTRAKDKPLEFISASTETGQTRYAAEWLTKLKQNEQLDKIDRKTAIVLCNETMLLPLIHGLPGKDVLDVVNITKGFPLTQTHAYTVFEELLSQAHIEDNCKLLNKLDEQIKAEALQVEDKFGKDTMQEQLMAEAYFRIHTTIEKFVVLMEKNLLEVKQTLLINLIRQVMHSLSVPFNGEPATGLQIMGVLETRNLDFENVLMLSVNEGMLPKAEAEKSLIPFELRKQFNLTTSSRKTAVYAYYFYRLLQRAKNITLLYNQTANDQMKGEQSRFMTQLQVEFSEDQLPIRKLSLTERQELQNLPKKTVTHKDALPYLKNKKRLSASALNDYISCPLKFYFSDLLYLKEPENTQTMMPANTFGSIYHKAMELLYRPYLGSPLSTTIFEQLLDDIKLEPIIKKSFAEVYWDELTMDKSFLKEHEIDVSLSDEEKLEQVKKIKPVAELSYEQYPIEFAVLKTYIKKTLNFDKNNLPMTIIKLEQKAYQPIPTQAAEDDLPQEVNVGGIIDRIDTLGRDGATIGRIVDYKTGRYDKKELEFADTADLFNVKKEKGYIFQTLLYSWVYTRNEQIPNTQSTRPNLLFIKGLGKEDFTTEVRKEKEAVSIENFEEENNFGNALHQLVQDIYSKDFTTSESDKPCRFCAFTLLCNRGATDDESTTE